MINEMANSLSSLQLLKVVFKIEVKMCFKRKEKVKREKQKCQKQAVFSTNTKKHLIERQLINQCVSQKFKLRLLDPTWE